MQVGVGLDSRLVIESFRPSRLPAVLPAHVRRVDRKAPKKRAFEFTYETYGEMRWVLATLTRNGSTDQCMHRLSMWEAFKWVIFTVPQAVSIFWYKRCPRKFDEDIQLGHKPNDNEEQAKKDWICADQLKGDEPEKLEKRMDLLPQNTYQSLFKEPKDAESLLAKQYLSEFSLENNQTGLSRRTECLAELKLISLVHLSSCFF